jgi:O-antigen ligase
VVNDRQSIEIEKRRRKFVSWWISALITVPILLDFVFLGSSAARYSRVIICSAIVISLLANFKIFLASKIFGVETLVLTSGIFLIGTSVEILHGGSFTPNFAIAILILVIVSANIDLYSRVIGIFATNVHVLIFASTLAILFRLNPRGLYFSAEGYPVLLNFLGNPGRNYGIFSHPNGLGQVATISLLLIIALNSNRYLLIFPIFCLIKCGSRTSIAGAAAGLIVYSAVLLFKRRQLSGKSSNLESPIVFATFIFGILLAGSYQFLNLISLLDPTSLTNRATIWQTTATLFKESPTFGLGWNWEARAIDSQLLNVWATSAHNAILDVSISTGTIGLLLFFLLLAKVLAFFSNLVPAEKMILASVLISGVSESYINLQYPTVSTILFLVIVLAANRDKAQIRA